MTIAVRKAGEWAPALAVFVLGIALWQGAIVAFHVQQFLLPRPSAIVRSLWDDRHTLWPAGWYTFKEALGGFFIGSLELPTFGPLCGLCGISASRFMTSLVRSKASASDGSDC